MYEHFLRLDGVPGDSQAPGHEGEIVVKTFEMEQVRVNAEKMVGGFRITKEFDGSSRHLDVKYRRQDPIGSGTLTIRWKESAEFFAERVLSFTGLRISEYTGGSIETLSFRFKEITTSTRRRPVAASTAP